ncbi:MAG TPA: glycoside hydrolase family 3 N-terminal domain-containing protein [Sphingomonas sp.]|nr:glycoside hydrolase family 3 N-terminal domain-containing protein [Sphingomonas sp.]
MTPPISRRSLIKAGGALAGFALAPRAAFAASNRIESLIGKMTLTEKAGQLSCFGDSIRPPRIPFNPNAVSSNAARQLADIAAGKIGMLFNGIGVSGARRAQKAAIEDSRLKIPLVFAGDVIHGLATVFPIPIAEAGAFDPDLAMRTARAAALEATAVGMHWTFAPMVDVARDERWGRVAEGSGEDTYLGEQMAIARVRGFQGDDPTDPTRVAACPKHFAAYGAVAAGMDYNTVDLSMETLREVHFPPFQAAFGAGALTTMSAFNDVNGVPASGNHWLLTELLRDQWHFKGLVVSDYTADEELIAHGYAADGRDAAKKAFIAGVDMSMQSGLYNQWLPDLVEKGEVPEAQVDASVRRVLALKEQLGLFDNPYRSMSYKAEKTHVAMPATRKLSREAGGRSIVLLKNENKLLPLSKSPGKIALIGPFGDDKANLAGPWAFMADESIGVDIASGIRAQLADPEALTVVKGADVEKPIPGGIDAAVAAATAADLVILAIGESQGMSGEAQSRVEIVVPEPQQALADAVAATGKPVVVLLKHGRALALQGAVKDAPAILACWFLGSETGNAIADVLFGKVNPSAKLSVSFPHYSGQEPYFYNHRPTGRPAPDTGSQAYKARYRETKNEALYPFGHGLTYSDIVLSELKLPATLAWNGTLEVSALVTNRGTVAGAEVVQLYIHDRVASRTRPVRELKGFRRVALAPGEAKRVTFSLARKDLQFWGDGGWTVEPGAFDLWIATSSVNGLKGKFDLTAT